MRLKHLLPKFLRQTDAAVTVDWVLLTGALVAVGLGVVIVVQAGLATQATSISASIISSVSAVLS